MIDILLSTMHGVYPDWVSQANGKVRVIIIDQCDVDEVGTDMHGNRLVRTTERGLSRSRNMALAHSDARFCMFCDNDIRVDFPALEVLGARLDSGALAAEVLITSHPKHNFLSTEEEKPLGWRGISRVASWQIVVNRDFLAANGIRIDEGFGLGAETDHGEENILLADILRSRGRILLVPDQVVYHPDEGTGYRFGPNILQKKAKIFRRMYGAFWVFPFVGFTAKNFQKIVKSGKRKA